MEYYYWFLWGYFFKVDVLFNINDIFLEVFWINASVMDARLQPLLSFRFGFFYFVAGVCHGFLLKFILGAFSL